MDEPIWLPEGWVAAGILVLAVRGVEVARVTSRGGVGWNSMVNRHIRDWRRHTYAVVANERMAKRFAERWARANIERIVPDLPFMVPGPCGSIRKYPASNPEYPFV